MTSRSGLRGAPAAVRPGRGRQRREMEIVTRVRAAHAEVSTIHGAAIAIPTLDASGPPARCAEVVAVLLRCCSDRLRQVHAADPETSGRLCDRILELQQLALEIYEAATRARTERMEGCGSGLSHLRAMTTTAALFEHACEEAVLRCGFERVVLSRVDGTTWRPWLAYSTDRPGLAAWFPSWIDKAITLDGSTPEAHLLTDRRPSIVYDTSQEQVHRGIIVDAGHSQSYVVVPVLQDSTVVGFLHADQHQNRRVDETDRDVLWAFAVGFGYVHERTVLLERLRAQREEARDILAAALDGIEDLCELGGRPTERAASDDGSGPVTGPFGTLTARETEVFRLLAAGATNAAIADRLVIAEDTVKCHVKHVLGKLGASNRAQAVAWSHARREAD